MADAVSVRLDDESWRALAALEATGLNRSEAIRRALVETAQRQRRHLDFTQEVAALQADAADRDEMAEVASLMEQLHTPR